MSSIVKEKTTHVSLTIALTQAEDDLHVHDYRIEARPEGEDKKDYLVFSEFYKSPMPNPLNIIISDLKPNTLDRKSTRLNSSHVAISYAVFCLKKKKIKRI